MHIVRDSLGRCKCRNIKSSGGGVEYIPQKHQTGGLREVWCLAFCHLTRILLSLWKLRNLLHPWLGISNFSQICSCQILPFSYHFSDQPLCLPFQVCVSILLEGKEGISSISRSLGPGCSSLPWCPRHHFISCLLPLICPGSRLSLTSVFQVLSDFLRDGHFSLPSGLWEVGKSSKQGVRDKKGIRIDGSSKEEITQAMEVNVVIFNKDKSKLCFRGEHKPEANF